MPAFILLICGIGHHIRRRKQHLIAATWLIIAGLALVQIYTKQRHRYQVTTLPAGRAALTGLQYEEFVWLMQHTKPGDLFFQAQWLNLYPPLELRSPAFIDGLWPNELTRPESVDLTEQQIERQHVEYIFWSPRLVSPDDPNNDEEQRLTPFHMYLTKYYSRVHVFSDLDEIWRRR